MDEADQLAAAIEVVQAVYGADQVVPHAAEVAAVLAAIRANYSDGGAAS